MSFDLILPFLRPIEPLLLDDSISEVMGNPDGSWWFEQDGKLNRAGTVRFDAKALRTGLEVIANHLGKRFDESHPLLNAQLPDGSRLAAVLPPVVRPGPSLTVRKFAKGRYTLLDLIERRALSEEMGEFLRQQVFYGKTMLISGGTSSGKTTLLNALADAIPEEERIVVIEDTAELRIGKPNVLAAECQGESLAGVVDFAALLKGALRWRPDRIILGEVRGEEARTLLDSFNTGHGGSLATIHANSPVKALQRFCELAMRSHPQSLRDDIAAEIADSVDYVIQVQRTAAGRCVTEIAHVQGFSREAKCFALETVFPTLQESSLATH